MKALINILKEAKGEKPIKLGKERKKLNAICYEVSKIRWEHPIDALKELQTKFKPLGIVIVQEDGTKWAGMFSKGKAGKENSTKFEIAYIKGESEDSNEMHGVITNSLLIFSWYQNDDKAKSEVNCYIS